MAIENYQYSQVETYMIGAYRIIESGARTPWVEGTGAENFPIPPGCTDADSSPGVAWQGNPGQGGVDQPAFDPAVQGETAFAQIVTPPGSMITWELTGLVRKWKSGESPNYGMFLRDLTSPNNSFGRSTFSPVNR